MNLPLKARKRNKKEARDATAKAVGWFGFTLAGLAGLVILGLFFFGWYEFFGPRYRAVDNRIYHRSQQYTDAKKQRLDDFYQAYQSADSAGKASIKSIAVAPFELAAVK